MFDIYCAGTTSNALGNFFFACSSTGAGTCYRHECRNFFNGGGFVAAPSTFAGSLASPPSGTTPSGTPAKWQNIKIQITAAGVATYYVNGTAGTPNNTFTIVNSGTYIAFNGDAGNGGTNQYDNIRIYDGII
jgi:hypothetical protein